MDTLRPQDLQTIEARISAQMLANQPIRLGDMLTLSQGDHRQRQLAGVCADQHINKLPWKENKTGELKRAGLSEEEIEQLKMILQKAPRSEFQHSRAKLTISKGSGPEIKPLMVLLVTTTVITTGGLLIISHLASNPRIKGITEILSNTGIIVGFLSLFIYQELLKLRVRKAIKTLN